MVALTLACLLHVAATTSALVVTAENATTSQMQVESERVLTLKSQTFLYVVMPLVVAFYSNPRFVTKSLNEAFGHLRQYHTTSRPPPPLQSSPFCSAMIGGNIDVFGYTFKEFCSQSESLITDYYPS